MRAAFVAVALAACGGPGATGPDGDRGTLGVAVRAAEIPGWLDALSVRVEQVVVEGEGPEGPASVSAEVGEAFSLVDGDPRAPIPVLLSAGRWDPVRVTLHLATRDGTPALAADGEGEEVDFSLAVLELTVTGVGGLSIPADGVAEAAAVFVPGAWEELRELESDDDDDDGDDDDDDDDPVEIDVAGDRERYDEVVEEIAESTRIRFPEDDE